MHYAIEQLIKFRKEQGITQADLAEVIGIEPVSLSRIERGQVNRIDINLIEKAAKALNKRLMDFLEPENAEFAGADGKTTTFRELLEENKRLHEKLEQAIREKQLQERIIKLMEEKEKK